MYQSIKRCLSKQIIFPNHSTRLYIHTYNTTYIISYRKPIDAHHQRASSYSGSQHTPSVATTVRPQSPHIPIQSPVYSPLYVNKNVLNGNVNETPLLYDDANSLNNYSLLCHGVGAGANNAVKKRDKLRHRFSDVGSWGRKRKNKKGIRQFHSMNETIEVLADPVIEDDIFVSTQFLFFFTFVRNHKLLPGRARLH